MEFSKFCNICFKEENVLNISTEENAGLLNTLITLIGQPEVAHENNIYLCRNCCNKLEDINIFRNMCIKNFIHFRQSCHDFKREFKDSNDSDISGKMKIFIDSKVRNQNSCVENLKGKDSDSPEDREIQLEQVSIKEEPEDMLPESESALDHNVHDNMDLETELKFDLVESRKLGSEINPENTTKESKVKKAHICNVCKKPFKNSSNLSRHRLIHTGEKPHRCPLCRKTFSQSGYLKIHLRLHTGEKPHECETCKRTFTDLSNLYRHQRTHTDIKLPRCEKNLTCNVCNKTFRRSHDLKIHERVHTRERPFLCIKCHKTFTQSSHLRRHVRLSEACQYL